MKSLSIIIVTYNSAGTIEECLCELAAAAFDTPEADIIVIDNNSTDQTLDIILQKFPSVTVIRNERNIGFGAAANGGARHAKGEFLFLLNPDTVVEKSLIRQIMSFEYESLDRSAVGCQFIDRFGKPQPSSWRLPTLGTIMVESFLPYNVSTRLLSGNARTIAPTEMVSGGCMILSRSLFDSLGGFDERFFLYYEDADLCLRLRRAGGRVLLNPEWKIFHHGRKSFGNNLQGFFIDYYKGKLRYCEKNFSLITYELSKLSIITGIILRIVLYNFVGFVFRREKLSHLAANHRVALRSLSFCVPR